MPVTSAADALYARLIDLFGTGGTELFSMEWPGRVLDESTYRYEVDDVYSELSKPQAVLEAEFRLSDELLDVAPLVAGPNGKKLSVEFLDALSQMVPAYTGMGLQYGVDKEKIREWLLEPISLDYVDDKGETQQLQDVARIEAYDILNESYERAVAVWDEEKTKRLRDAQATAVELRTQALEQYAKWLAEEAAPREAILEARFADLVVKAYYHEVRAAVATLDIALPGETLEIAKGRMRSSAMSSLDESETVYPVEFSPADWATGLSTDFQPVDLLMDPSALQQQLLTKQQQIAQLSQQITFFQSTQTGDPAKLQEAVDAAQSTLDAATTELTEDYGENTLTIARMYFGTVGVEAAEQKALDTALEAAGDDGLTPEQWAALKEGYTKIAAAQEQLTTASRNLTELQAALMTAKTTDSAQAIAALTSQVAVLQQQAQQLEATLYSDSTQKRLQAMQSTTAAGAVTWDPAKAPEAAVDATSGALSAYPMLPTPMPAPGEFMDVVVNFTGDKMDQASNAEASATQTSWSLDLFFGSAGGSSSSSESTSNATFQTASTTVDIGFRAMKVIMDRGGWFDPSVFDLSAEMSHIVGSGASYTPISRGLPQFKSGKSYTGESDEHEAFDALQPAVLPGYPTGFLVAKDVTVVIKLADADTAKQAHAQAASSTVGGGVFCFSANSSSSSSSSSAGAQSVQIGESVVIKIPGPQILGWFQEYTPADQSADYKAMPDGYYPEAAKELRAERPLLAAAVTPLAPLVQAAVPDVDRVNIANGGSGNGGGHDEPADALAATTARPTAGVH